MLQRTLFVAALFLITLTAQAEEMTHSKDSLEDIKKAVDSGKAVLIDVREQTEYDISHVKGITLVPSSAVKADPKKTAEKLPKDKPIYIHCASGGRALRCATAWKDMGYDVRAVTYNVGAFEKAGFAIEKGK